MITLVKSSHLSILIKVREVMLADSSSTVVSHLFTIKYILLGIIDQIKKGLIAE
jgi:hypothetical protein